MHSGNLKYFNEDSAKSAWVGEWLGMRRDLKVSGLIKKGGR